ncbi:MAG: nucleotide exchange factor GrpE [Deltaproteobacteria bacterium]|nr:nucleotide exchange factor GrpE [Deltaproteobacteria bacterium]MCB9788047.1 nucleotide exchange factor GrpE [Deltaproteobacteria bacterium]
MGDEDNGQFGNVPVIRIDDDELGDLATMFEGEATEPEPESASTHHVDLEAEDFEALLLRALGEASGEAAPRGPVSQPRIPVSQALQRAAMPQPPPPDRQAVERHAIEESRVVGELRNKLKELTSETDRYRRRIAEEAAGARASGRADVCKQILPTLDALELALHAAKANHDVEQLTRGLDLVVRQLGGALSAVGLEEIPAAGAPFDPAMHEAFQQRRTGSAPPGTVIDVLRRGWTFNGKLLRAAQVVVESS